MGISTSGGICEDGTECLESYGEEEDHCGRGSGFCCAAGGYYLLEVVLENFFCIS